MNTELPAGYQQFYNEIKSVRHEMPLITDPLRTIAIGTDASFYRLVPKIVVDVASEKDVITVLKTALKFQTPVTFRAAGTSLSGQSITDCILVRLALDQWRAYQVLDKGELIKLQPGVIGANANQYLLPFQRKIGPDPSSINSAKIGGIAANNASGNCCGIAQNSYQTLHSIRVVLADGSVIDTSDSQSIDLFRQTHEELLRELSHLAEQTKNNTSLADRIKYKYRIKNTMGYSLNALLDFTDPVDILAHLMIGSEGTLGFISEITYQTVVEHTHKASSLTFFEDIESACRVVALLKNQSVSAVELMDRRAINSVERQPGMPNYLSTLPELAAALLIETRAESPAQLELQIQQIKQVIDQIKTIYPVVFTSKPEEFNALWKIRKGLFPAVGAVRENGTTVIIEDIAFDVSNLAQGTLDLQQLFQKHNYDEAIIFGHALEGNLHFVFTQDFSSQTEVQRYRAFMDDVCDMVINKYDGSLKAEHSTGRNMAPFLEMEWGPQAFALMQQIKQLFDPQNILNPGVIFNDSPTVHIQNLKPLYPVDSLIDKCIECGFCEPFCPSRALSLTPRQRIIGLREIHRLKGDKNVKHAIELEKLFQYQGVKTCAGDSLCSIQCPVGIDTGKMMKSLRADKAGSMTHNIANWITKHYQFVEKTSRLSLNTANLAHTFLGTTIMSGICRTARKISGNRIPLWNKYMPKGASVINYNSSTNYDKKVVYFPSCASRMMGPAKGDNHNESLHVVTARLLGKAGFEVIIPKHIDGYCCGMPFESKGLNQQAKHMLDELDEILRKSSNDGVYPIVFDTSPCSFRTRNNSDLNLYDLTEFLHDHVLDRLEIEQMKKSVAIHSTCSNIKMNSERKLRTIAQRCVSEVIVPDGVSCCGWAGDKGFTQPELNASATQLLKQALPSVCKEGYSTSRTCEIGLSLHSDRYYRSIVYLLDECSSPLTIINDQQ